MEQDVTPQVNEDLVWKTLISQPPIQRLYMFEQCGGKGELEHELARAPEGVRIAWEYLHTR